MVSRRVTPEYFDDNGKRNVQERTRPLVKLGSEHVPYEVWLEQEHARQKSMMNPTETLEAKKASLVKRASERQAGGAHYKDFPIQPAEYCQKNKLGFMESNVVKYVSRHDRKGKAKDIKKAIHMLELLLEFEYGEQYKQGEEV